MNVIFLIYDFRARPHKKGTIPCYLYDGNSIERISWNEIHKIVEPVVTLGAHKLAGIARAEKIKLPNIIFDIYQIAKLVRGKPIRLSKNITKGILTLATLYQDKYPFTEKLLNGLRNPAKSLNHAELYDLATWTKSIFELLVFELRQRGEYDRYFKIEVPVHKILLESQIIGLSVDETRVREHLCILDYEIRHLEKQLRDGWGVQDPQYKTWISNTLVKEGYVEVARYVENGGDDKILGLISETKRLASLYYKWKKSFDSKLSLLRLSVLGESVIYPWYDLMGTVSGRIIVRDPVLQNIQKRYRDIFLPSEANIFVYPDYAQFEPSILQAELGFEAVGTNRFDIYNDLARTLFGDIAYREKAKIIILCLIYGMSEKKIEDLIKETTGITKKASRNAINSIERRFPGFVEWKHNMERQALLESRIGSRLGNYRYLTSYEITHMNLPNWIVNQRIQGTASLILKKAIILVSKNLPNLSLKLPMHDAILYESPLHEDTNSQIEAAFKAAYTDITGNDNIRIEFKRFQIDE